jgi:hypothetical protein
MAGISDAASLHVNNAQYSGPGCAFRPSRCLSRVSHRWFAEARTGAGPRTDVGNWHDVGNWRDGRVGGRVVPAGGKVLGWAKVCYEYVSKAD